MIAATELRNYCVRRLKNREVLVLNMAGVKEVSAGFARECFGYLYLEANKAGARIKFSCVEDSLRMILLKGIKSVL